MSSLTYILTYANNDNVIYVAYALMQALMISQLFYVLTYAYLRSEHVWYIELHQRFFKNIN